jgi:hypothetical protein
MPLQYVHEIDSPLSAAIDQSTIQPHSQPSMIMPGQPPAFMPGPYMHPMSYQHHMQPART